MRRMAENGPFLSQTRPPKKGSRSHFCFVCLNFKELPTFAAIPLLTPTLPQINMGDTHALDDWKLEQEEWLEALEEVLEGEGKGRTAELFQRMRYLLARHGVANGGAALNTPYLNSIAAEDTPAYPGDLALEQRIEHIIRWHARSGGSGGQCAGHGVARRRQGLGVGGAYCHFCGLCHHVGGAVQPFFAQAIC